MAEGWRARIIADADKRFDMRALLRLGAWGTAALAALIIAIVAGRTDAGARRALAAFQPSEPPATITFAPVVADLRSHAAENDRELRKLGDSVRTLREDGDRLTGRIGTIERDIKDLTGSVGRALATASAAKAAADAASEGLDAFAKPHLPGKPQAAAEPAGGEKAMPTPDKRTAAIQTTPPPPALAPEPSKPPPPEIAKPMPPPPTAATPVTASAPPAAPHASPATGSLVPPPRQPAANGPPAAIPKLPEPEGAATTGTVPIRVPLPRPGPTAATPAPNADKSASTEPPNPFGGAAQSQPTKPAEATGTASSENPPLPKVEIGVDLGPALNLARLRSRWSDLQAKHQTLFEGMRPLVALRETAQGKSVEIRLVIGPVADIAAAADVCNALSGTQFICQPAVFDGQRLGTR
jgi:hypothetical protein